MEKNEVFGEDRREIDLVEKQRKGQWDGAEMNTCHFLHPLHNMGNGVKQFVQVNGFY